MELNTELVWSSKEAMLEFERVRCQMSKWRQEDYNPHTGRWCTGERTVVRTPVEGLRCAEVPVAMLRDERYGLVQNDAKAWQQLRFLHDFEYWCACCVTIKHKLTGAMVPFHLNGAQQHVLCIIEEMRLAGEPIRLIMLKARQWGGSTLVQIYMAWIQSCHRRNWHSVICAHNRDTASVIRGMYSTLLEHYPEEHWDGDCKPSFKPFERTDNIRTITGRGCHVTIASAESPDSIRGTDFAMAHLSEAAFWRTTRRHSPTDVIRAVTGSVPLEPYSVVVVESTANGIGNYFHNEWLRSCEGVSDKRAIFVAWYEVDMYSLEVKDKAAFLDTLTPYELDLWNRGLSLDQINWHRRKQREYQDITHMYSEFPSTAEEAFVNSSSQVFASQHVEAMRREGCTEDALKGEIKADGSEFVPSPTGCLEMWRPPEPGRRYVAAVDVGGRSPSSDWSVVSVMKVAERLSEKHEVVAQWRGHLDHDILAHTAAAIGRHYNMARLIIESNTFETGSYGGADSNLFILNRIAETYPNLYVRRVYDELSRTYSTRVGFHTNRSTKALVVAGLIEAVREGRYIEHSSAACNELLTYEQTRSGVFAAKEGCHDDILMTRALAIHAVTTEPKIPVDFRRHMGQAVPGW